MTFMECVLGRSKFPSLFNNFEFEYLSNIQVNNHFTKQIKRSEYQIINIWNEEDIISLISYIFNSNEYKEILKKYKIRAMSADHFVSYTNLSINTDDLVNSYYAERPHFDKTFSFNTLKIFILQGDVDLNGGPLHYYKKNNLFYRENCDGLIFKKFTGNSGLAIIGSAAKNLHFAGIPANGKSRTQILIQLNPSKVNRISSDIYKRQFGKEINFPFYRNLLN
jgi:hypothetical protein